MRRPWPALMVLVGAMACSAAPLDRDLSSAAARSAIVISSDGAGPTGLRAIALGDTPAEQAYSASDHVAELTALLYDRPLAELSLAAGDLTLSAGGRALPATSTVFQLDVRERGDWTRRATLPSTLTQIAIPPPCRALKQTAQYAVDAPGALPTMLVALDPNHALVSLEKLGSPPSNFVIDPRGATRPETLRGAPLFRSGYLDPTGVVWLLADDAKLWHGDLERGFFDGPRMIDPRPYGLFWLDGSHDGAPFELFAMTASIGIEHYKDGAWRTVRFASPERRTDIPTGLAWVAPGRAVAIGFDTRSVIEVSDLGPEEKIIALPPVPLVEDELFSIRYLDSFGAVIGTRSSRLVIVRAGYAVLPIGPLTARRAFLLESLAPGGLLYGGEHADYGEYFQGYGYCPSVNFGVAETHLAAPLAGGWAFVTPSPKGFLVTLIGGS